MTNDELRALDLTAWPVPDEYLIEVGRLSWLWATLEEFLALCIGKLARFGLDDPTPFILLAHTNFPQRLDMLTSLCQLLLPRHPELNDYSAVAGELRSAQTLRNKFLHNGIAYDEETKVACLPLATARGTLKARIETVTPTDIRRACVEVHNAHRALYKLVLRKDYPPIWETRAQRASKKA